MLVLYYHSNALYLSSVVQLSRFNRFDSFCVESFVIIPHLFRFVNTFLKSFLNFFMVFNFALFRGSRAFCTQLAYYITLHPLCQYLFEKFFKKFFSNLSLNLSDRQGCVLYIKPCFSQLDYYSTKEAKSQYLFCIFFNIVRYDKMRQNAHSPAVKIYKRAYFLTLKRLKSRYWRYVYAQNHTTDTHHLYILTNSDAADGKAATWRT